MNKTKQEQIDICVEYFKKSHKQEKLMGTLVFTSIIVATIALFPLINITFIALLLYFLLYLKFLHDIKRKFNNAISEFREKAVDENS